MSRNEELAAILIRLDRGLIGPELLRLFGNLHLIHSDERSKERKLRRFFDHGKILRRLGCDLPQAISGHESPAAFTPRQLFCNAHHDPTIEHDAEWSRSTRHELPLNLTEWHHIQLRMVLIGCQQSSEFERFVLRRAADQGGDPRNGRRWLYSRV